MEGWKAISLSPELWDVSSCLHQFGPHSAFIVAPSWNSYTPNWSFFPRTRFNFLKVENHKAQDNMKQKGGKRETYLQNYRIERNILMLKPPKKVWITNSWESWLAWVTYISTCLLKLICLLVATCMVIKYPLGWGQKLYYPLIAHLWILDFWTNDCSSLGLCCQRLLPKYQLWT